MKAYRCIVSRTQSCPPFAVHLRESVRAKSNDQWTIRSLLNCSFRHTTHTGPLNLIILSCSLPTKCFSAQRPTSSS